MGQTRQPSGARQPVGKMLLYTIGIVIIVVIVAAATAALVSGNATKTTTTSTTSTPTVSTTSTSTIPTTTTPTTTSVSTTTVTPSTQIYSVTYNATSSSGALQNTGSKPVFNINGQTYPESMLPLTLTYPSNYTISFAAMLNVLAANGTQYAYASLSGCGQNSVSGTFTPVSNCTITAHYNKQYLLTLLANNSLGSVNASPQSVSGASGYYNAGSQVRITATPYTYNYFVGWTCAVYPAKCYPGAYTGLLNSTIITMNNQVAEMALFSNTLSVPLPYDTAGSNSGGSFISVSTSPQDTHIFCAGVGNITSTNWMNYAIANNIAQGINTGNTCTQNEMNAAPGALVALGTNFSISTSLLRTFINTSQISFPGSFNITWNNTNPNAYTIVLVGETERVPASPSATFSLGNTCTEPVSRTIGQSGSIVGFTAIYICAPHLPKSGFVNITYSNRAQVAVSVVQVT